VQICFVEVAAFGNEIFFHGFILSLGWFIHIL
jgi:hypothetical protein